MTRAQAILLSALLGLVLLVFMGLIFIYFIPLDNPTPGDPAEAIPPTPALPTPTATFPNFMPTPSNVTPIVEPSATNTRLPTSTPTPFRTDTPTVVVTLNLVNPKPTATSTPPPLTTDPTPTETTEQSPTATLPLQYDIQFNARNPTVREGDCTYLEWRVTGANNIQLEGKAVTPTGREEVCPSSSVTYQLVVILPDGVPLSRSVTVSVK